MAERSAGEAPGGARSPVENSTAQREWWQAPAATDALQADVRLPGSKSLTNRYLVVAALADDRSRLRRPLRSRDTLLMAEALRRLGVEVSDTEGEPASGRATGPASGKRQREGTGAGGDSPNLDADLDWIVTPAHLRGHTAIDVGLSGTVMRFLPPVAALADGPVHFDGDHQARTRPMAPLLTALRRLDISVDDGGRGTLPFTVTGSGAVTGGEISLDASASSQFVSALLLAGPRYRRGVTVRHVGPAVPSQPHVAMTVEILRDAGVDVDDDLPNQWRVEPCPLRSLDVEVEPDLSNAGPFLAAALVAGGRVRVPGWPQHTTQAGDALRDILDAMGGDVVLDREGLTVTGGGQIEGIDVDLHDASELTTVVAALAVLADSPTVIRGVAHIRGHETDRIAALVSELARLGADIESTPDGLRIRPAQLSGGRFHTYRDHRMATAGAIVGLRVPDVLIEDVETTAKTLPGFVERWTTMLSSTR